ncbi:MAG: 4-hydroxybenzoate octaprenyltransferase [Pseudomonadota bacterium]
MSAPETSPEPARNGSTDQIVADAVDGNWVDTRAPASWRPWLRLARLDRPAGTWLLLIPCWWGLALAIAADPASATLYDLWIAVGCGIGALLMRSAGCAWNDLTDRNYDGKVERTKLRPIPAGQITPEGAFLFACGLSILAFFVLLTFNLFTIVLACASLGLVAIYPFAKRFTWWPQVFLGLAFNWGALVGWSAHTGSLGWPPILLYCAGIAWTLFYDTIYAHQDIEDDALIGVKSTARLFGEASPRWLFGFLVTSVSFLGAAAILALAPGGQGLGVAAALLGVWAFGWHLAMQLRRVDIDVPEVCMQVFRTNREAGCLPVAGFCLAALASGLA